MDGPSGSQGFPGCNGTQVMRLLKQGEDNFLTAPYIPGKAYWVLNKYNPCNTDSIAHYY